jgi:hypothetical protein
MATAFAPAIAKSLSIIYSLLYSSLLYSTLLCRLFRRKYPEMLLSVHIRADMRSKRYFRSGYIVFRGILGQLRVLSCATLLSTFST